MKQEIVYFDPLNTAKALIIVYHVFTVPILLLKSLVEFFRDGLLPGADLIGMLVLNAVLGFCLLWIACRAYNWVAERFGGIEITLREAADQD